MPSRKQNNDRSTADTHVWIDKAEYAALRAFQETTGGRLVEEEKIRFQIHELSATCSVQARRLTEVELTTQHLERMVGLQRALIEYLRSGSQVAALEDLSLFWRSWIATTERDPSQRSEVNRIEPDLFKSWRLWVRDAGRASRTMSVAGTTRAEVEERTQPSQAALQDHIIDQQRQTNAVLVTRISELEAEVEAYRKGKAKP